MVEDARAINRGWRRGLAAQKRDAAAAPRWRDVHSRKKRGQGRPARRPARIQATGTKAPRAPADPTPSRSRSIFERISGAPNARSRGIQDTIPSYGPLENRNIRESNLEMVNPVTLNADGILRSADWFAELVKTPYEPLSVAKIPLIKPKVVGKLTYIFPPI